MSATKAPPEWAMARARDLIAAQTGRPFICDEGAVETFASYIAAHEQPPPREFVGYAVGDAVLEAAMRNVWDLGAARPGVLSAINRNFGPAIRQRLLDDGLMVIESKP